MTEGEPGQPDFEARKKLIKQIKPRDLVKLRDLTMRNVTANNEYFPYYLWGIDVKTNESTFITLEDGNLPVIIPGVKSQEIPESPEGLLHQGLQEIIKATGDPMIGILSKVFTKEGMSSQLIIRYDAIKRKEIKDLLPGEKDYEGSRHSLHVFYETINYCEIPEESRKEALSDMLNLKNIQDENERKKIAKEHPIFGLETGKNIQ